MEEEARPSQENPLPKMHRDRQALAENLRVWTREEGPERESIPKGKDKKNNTLDSIALSSLGWQLSCQGIEHAPIRSGE